MFSSARQRFFGTPAARRRSSIVLLIIVLLACAAHATIVHRTSNTQDFAIFYRAADAMRHGASPYETADGRHSHYIYPPLLAFALQPLAFLSEENAALLWTLASAASVFLGALFIARRAAAHWQWETSSTVARQPQAGSLRYLGQSAGRDDSIPWMIAALATLLMVDKVHTILVLGQTDSLMLLGFVLAFYWMERRPLLAGIAVGLTASIKYLSLIFVPYFLLKRNYRAAIASVLAFVFFMLLPAVQVGIENESNYLSLTSRGMARMIGAMQTQRRVKVLPVTWERSVSVTSALFRFTRAHGLPDAAAIALILVTFAALIATILLVARRHGLAIFGRRTCGPSHSLEWATLVVVTLVFSPQSTSRHLFLLLIPYAIALAILFSLPRSVSGRWLIVSLVLLVAATSFPNPFIDTWRILGGASWCALLFLLALAATGSRMVKAGSSFDPSPAIR